MSKRARNRYTDVGGRSAPGIDLKKRMEKTARAGSKRASKGEGLVESKKSHLPGIMGGLELRLVICVKYRVEVCRHMAHYPTVSLQPYYIGLCANGTTYPIAYINFGEPYFPLLRWDSGKFIARTDTHGSNARRPRESG